MKIPFGLHRRIPRVRRLLEYLAQAVAERDMLREELAVARQRISMLEVGVAGHAATSSQYPLVVVSSDAKLGSNARRILSLLRPMDVSGEKLVRKGRLNDGGYIMVEKDLRNGIAYSLGINNDVSWDLDMAALGCQIFQYDHTIDALPQEHPSFHWFKTGIASRASVDEVLQPLSELIARNGHAERRDIILKMDIEGAEWEVFDSMDRTTLDQFSQIVVELHMLAFASHELQEKITSVLEKLRASHQCVHVHANNHGYFGIVGGVPLPDAMEITYVRRADYSFVECKRVFPTEMDMPCRGDVPDFYLGTLGALPDPAPVTASQAT